MEPNKWMLPLHALLIRAHMLAEMLEQALQRFLDME
uniref:Uncharacterized protein n=1 Tax=Picea glauca TaxID=3330 RepID=A0A117NFY4_PICGL|nr:hypothetical protein ABT39_MTgene2036 [Picea glauca]QHR91157.1 hypothetical protein Q903MT_gene5189 [Picea sitchensis]